MIHRLLTNMNVISHILLTLYFLLMLSGFGITSYASAYNSTCRSDISTEQLYAKNDPETLSGNCGAEGDGTNVKWSYSDGTLTISGSGRMIDKNEVDNQMISHKELDPSLVHKIIIENGVTNIGDFSFFRYENMTEIIMADSITSVGSFSFTGCNRLASVHFSNKLTTIKEHAFAGCSLETVDLPETLTTIEEYAFNGNAMLKAITIPPQVTYIGDFVFSFCTEMKTADLQCNITGAFTFMNCTSLTTVELSPDIKRIDGQCFEQCTDLRSITLPDNLESFGYRAFNGCSRLADLEIPDTVTQIEAGAFAGCCSLADIHLPETLTTISQGMLSYCSGLKSIDLPDSVTTIESNALEGLTITEITLPSKLETIEDNAFLDCGQIKYMNFPSTLKSIGKHAFHGCIELKNTGFPASLQSIGEGAFYDCANFDEVILPEGLTSIGRATFTPKRIVLPASLTNLSNYAFGEDRCIVYCSTSEQIEYCREFNYTYLDCSTVMSIKDSDIVTSADAYTHTGNAITPDVNISYAYDGQIIPLSKDFDYTVEYSDNINIGTGNISIQGINFFKETSTTTFHIYGSINACNIALSQTSYTYTGKELIPDVIVRYGNTTLIKDTDYSVAYSNNISVGTANVTVTGKGNYRGTRTLNYIISARTSNNNPTPDNNTRNNDINSGGTDSGAIKTVSSDSTETVNTNTDGQGDSNSANITTAGQDDTNPANITTYEQDVTNSVNINNDTINNSSSGNSDSSKPVNEYLIGKAYYNITGKNTAAYVRPKSTKYKTVNILTTVKINGRKYKVTSIAPSACEGCKSLKTVVIGNNIKTVGDNAFANCSKLSSITFGKNVERIGKKVLYGDNKIKLIKFNGKKVKSIGKKTFCKVPRSANILVPNSMVSKYVKLINAASR